MAARSTRFTSAICSSRRRRSRSSAWTNFFHSPPRNRRSKLKTSLRRRNRLRLLRLALAGKMNYEIDDQEIRRGGIFPTRLKPWAITQKNFRRRNYLPHRRGQHFQIERMARRPANWRSSRNSRRPRPGEPAAEISKPFRGKILKGFPVLKFPRRKSARASKPICRLKSRAAVRGRGDHAAKLYI